MPQLNFFKQSLYQQLLSKLNEKIVAFQDAVSAIKESIANETKSTAGDKYETARAMLHIEQENISRQLNNVLTQRNELYKLENIKIGDTIIPGTLIATDNGIFYLSIGFGQLKIDDQTIIVLSPQAPLGRVFLGLKKGDIAIFDNKQYHLLEIN